MGNDHAAGLGEMIVLVDDAFHQEHVISHLRSVSFNDYKARKAQWDQRLSRVILHRKFNRNTDAYLKDLEQFKITFHCYEYLRIYITAAR